MSKSVEYVPRSRSLIFLIYFLALLC